MTRKRAGFHNLFCQIPDAIWTALEADSAQQGESITKIVTELLRRNYRVPKEKIPRPMKTGRKPKK